MAYSVAGPYHGAYATVPLWRPRVEPNEYSLSYLLIGGTVDRSYHPIRGKGPPDISYEYQIAIGLAVRAPSALFTSIFQNSSFKTCLLNLER